MKNSITLHTFAWLVWRDVRALLSNFKTRWVDNACVIVVVVMLNNYVMPTFGLPGNFGMYMLVSQIVATTLYIIFEQGSALVVDLAGSQAITYELTLPLPSWLVYFKLVCVAALRGLILGATVLPVGLILVYNSLQVSVLTLLYPLIYPLCCIFFATFIMMIASSFRTVESFASFWMRWGMAIWMFGGLFAPWFIMYKASKLIAYATLANPVLYAFESMHVPFMGQAGFLNVWLCLAVMLVFGALFLFIGWRVFKRRLDCV